MSVSVCRQPTAVALSQCGSFGLIGYSSGRLLKFNVQSGIFRGEFQRRTQAAHDSSVVGCASDRFNRDVISAGSDGYLRFWSFKERKLMFQFSLGSPIYHLSLHRGNALCAVSTDDLQIRVFDCVARRRVRHFHDHKDRITCVEMSSDGRWLLSASMDRTLRIYDIPSALQIQSIAFKYPLISFSLSSSMEMLAMAHVNRNGVSLWTNQWIFGGQRSSGKGSEVPAVKIEDQGRRLTKLAMMPLSGWTIAYGATMKAQNQALKPVESAPSAPFFLPPMIGSSRNPQKSIFTEDGTEQEEPPKKKTKPETESKSQFLQHLQAFEESKDWRSFSTFLKLQSPIYIEQEILSISQDIAVGNSDDDAMDIDDLDVSRLCAFLQFIATLIEEKSDLEFSQVLLKLVLQANVTAILHTPTLGTLVDSIHEKLKRCWDPLAALMDATSCMIALFSDIHM